jgi:hypothetical protein
MAIGETKWKREEEESGRVFVDDEGGRVILCAYNSPAARIRPYGHLLDYYNRVTFNLLQHVW